MTDENAAKQIEEIIFEEQKDEENHEDDNVVSIKCAKLRKLQHTIKKLRDDVLGDMAQEYKECKLAFTQVNTLIGELHDVTGGKQQDNES